MGIGPRGVGGGVLGISSDKDDRRIFLGTKIWLGWLDDLDLSRDFLGVL